MLVEGRTVSVQPLTQTVLPIVCCVTSGFRAPGVQRGSGSEDSPEPMAWQEPGAGCDCTTVALATDSGSAVDARWLWRAGLRRFAWRWLRARGPAEGFAATVPAGAALIEVDDVASVASLQAVNEPAAITDRTTANLLRGICQRYGG